MPQKQLETSEMQNAELKMQNKFSAFRFPFSVLSSLIRTLTVGIGISPIQSFRVIR